MSEFVKSKVPMMTATSVGMANLPDTPMMRQYKAMKAEYPEAILFFRLGDFYEMFDQDAILASNALGFSKAAPSIR